MKNRVPIGHINEYRIVDRSSQFIAGTGRSRCFELYLEIGELIEIVPELKDAAQVDSDFSWGLAGIGYDHFCCCDDRIAMAAHTHAHFLEKLPD